MLEPAIFEIDGKPESFFPDVRSSKDLPVAIQFWTAYVARDLLQLGVFFRAMAIMLQVPGAGRYQMLLYDDVNPDRGDEEEDPARWVGEAERDTVFNVLGECLRRLEVESLIEQVPGEADYERAELSDEWKEYLDRQGATEHGLLNVVAECLDELMVRPGMAEIDDKPQATWWQRWWALL